MAIKIKIIDVPSQQDLYSFEIDEREKAYKKAQELEEMGLDIKLSIPSVTESLGSELKISESQMEELRQTIQSELDDHLGSCCVSTTTKN